MIFGVAFKFLVLFFGAFVLSNAHGRLERVETLVEVHCDVALGRKIPREVKTAVTANDFRVTGGRKKFERQSDVFRDPKKFLDPQAKLDDRDHKALQENLYKFLVSKGYSSGNASHIADHLAVVNDGNVSRALADAGINEAELKTLILAHDVGKEYDSLPEDYRAFLEKVFPKPGDGGPDKNYVNRLIMGHEFASMILIEDIGRSSFIPPGKIPELKALIARHNGGYDRLAGEHFWQDNWPEFAKAMKKAGIDVPIDYPPVLSLAEGGRPTTIILTAIDRATSWNLTSQEKFSRKLINTKSWNNESLVGQFKMNLNNVKAEVENVFKKLKSRDTDQNRKYKKVGQKITDYFSKDRENLAILAGELPQMKSGTGEYSDRPATTPQELSESVLYRTKAGRWYRVAIDGKVYEGNSGAWRPSVEKWEGSLPETILFRNFINPDFGYKAKELKP